MDQQTFQLVMFVITGLGGLVVSGLVFFLKELHKDNSALNERLANLTLKLAEQYTPKADVTRMFDQIMTKMEDLNRGLQHVVKNQAQMQSLKDELAKRTGGAQ